MPLLLNIDTATEIASVSVTRNGLPLAFLKNEYQKEHASFVHTAVATLLQKTGYQLKEFDAFAVTSGPGSYTGLRVGMATAKGFCYAFSKPLIAINTLEVMTKAALDSMGSLEQDSLFCPMIDARRMEVFTAIYNSDFDQILSPRPLILEEKVFNSYMKDRKILFFGSGSLKFMQIETNPNSVFADISYDARHLGHLAEIAFHKKNFSNISYSEPTYFKDFHSITKSSY
ncbi:tRNA (adenosine(37)-N6)-threonylcarbamoyltransferase complex dimerization subunit type 1 TsaB [Segetibacter koreensis]|uniref:tRNA (adenosine(37)-N6)-threonylcarbamoyltransferase complex dimerization subunit type 1 TsaB n=1 Tax=Segetibacter koreensis TaxID=398037 RepID=UPI0003717C2B|nr:tRNA (adenosine(37)-N6)-threonylcarbamoyltransferase complex dimerization subunit type 1 TsaB [Segetibacter koreensis]